MGNNASRNQYYAEIQRQAAAGALDLDPYEVFGLGKKFTWDELRDAYRHRAKLVHPDKGGSEVLFNAVTECFRKLAEEYKARNADRPHHELKEESMRHHAAASAAPVGRLDRNAEDFNSRFNSMFDQNKMNDEADYGYGDMMASSTGKREDISVTQLLAPSKATDKRFADRFNAAFDEATLPTSTAVANVEPEVLSLSRQLAYTEIGGGRPSEYTKTLMDTNNRGMAYTDYKNAYANTRLVDPRAVEERRAYRNVDEFISDRDARTEEQLTDAEIMRQAAKKKEIEDREQARIRRVAEADARHQAHYDRVSSLMLR